MKRAQTPGIEFALTPTHPTPPPHSPSEVLAFAWDTECREKARPDDLEKAVDERPSDHNMILYNRKKTVDAIDDRDFLSRVVWRTANSGSFVLVTTPTKSARRPELDKVVRAKFPSVMRMTRENDMTKIEYAIRPNWGGEIPAWVSNLYVGKNLARMTQIQEFFQSLRRLEDWDEEDGRAVGEAMCTMTKLNRTVHRELRFKELFRKHRGLKEVGVQYEWFQGMMSKVVANKLR